MCRRSVWRYVFVFIFLDFSLDTKFTARGNSHDATVQESLIEGVTFQEWAGGGGGSGDAVPAGVLRLSPPALALGRVELGRPRTATVTLTNAGNATLHLASLAGTTTHFHASFFSQKSIPVGGNATFSVVFLPRREGALAAHLYIHTSLGVHKYPVSGVGEASRWGAWPLRARAAGNATLSAPLTLYNPTDHTVQVTEVYSSAWWVQLELAGGGRAGAAQWAVPPHSPRTLLTLRVAPPHDAPQDHHAAHVAYVRIKGNMSDDAGDDGSLLVVVEAWRGPAGVELRPLQLRLGTRGALDPPYTVRIEAATNAEDAGPLEGGVWGAHCGPRPTAPPAPDEATGAHANGDAAHAHNGAAGGGSRGAEVAMLRSRLRPHAPPVPAASLTLRYDELWKSASANGANGGEAWCAGWARVADAAVPYSLRLLPGTLRPAPGRIDFVLEDSGKHSREHLLTVHNLFTQPVRVATLQHPPELLKYLEIESQAPLVVCPGCEAAVARVRLRAGLAPLRAGGEVPEPLEAALTLRTNLTDYSVSVPLSVYSGRLKIDWEWPHWAGGKLALGALSPRGCVRVRARVTHGAPHAACQLTLSAALPGASFVLAACERVARPHLNHSCRCIPAGGSALAVLRVCAGARGVTGGAVRAEWPAGAALAPVTLRTLPARGHVAAELRPRTPDAGDMIMAPYVGWEAQVWVHNRLAVPLKVRGAALSKDPALTFTLNAARALDAGYAAAVGYVTYAPELRCESACYTGVHSHIDAEDCAGEEALRAAAAQLRKRLAQLALAPPVNISLQLHTDQVWSVPVRGHVEAGWPRLAPAPPAAATAVLGTNVDLAVRVRNPSRSHTLLLHPMLGPDIGLPKQAGGAETRFCEREECSWAGDAFTLTGWKAARGAVREAEGAALLLPPTAEVDVTVSFAPTDARFYNTYLYLRNNLTVIEGVRLTGRGARPSFELAGRRPGDGHALVLEVDECAAQGSTAQRWVRLRNTGGVVVVVHLWTVAGQPWEGRGFRLEPCEPFTLPANSTRRLRLAYTADWTLGRAHAPLRLYTDTGTADFRLAGVAPPRLRAKCATHSPHPPWERAFRLVGLSFVMLGATLVFVGAPLDADKLLSRARAHRPVAPPADRAPLDLRVAAASPAPTPAPPPARPQPAPPRRRKPQRRAPPPPDPVAERQAFERWRADVLRADADEDTERLPGGESERSDAETPSTADEEVVQTEPEPLPLDRHELETEERPPSTEDDALSTGTESSSSGGDERDEYEDEPVVHEEQVLIEDCVVESQAVAVPLSNGWNVSTAAENEHSTCETHVKEAEWGQQCEKSVAVEPVGAVRTARGAGGRGPARRERVPRRPERPPTARAPPASPRPAPPPSTLRQGATWSSVVAAKGTSTPPELGPIGSALRRASPPARPVPVPAPSPAADNSLFFFNGDSELWRTAPPPAPPAHPSPFSTHHYTNAATGVGVGVSERGVAGTGAGGAAPGAAFPSVWGGEAWGWVRPPPGFSAPPLRPFDPFRSLAAIWAPEPADDADPAHHNH